MMKLDDHMPRIDLRSPRFCLCCHVKTGTLLFGLIVSLGDILFLSLLIFAAIHPDVLTPHPQPKYDGIMLIQTGNASVFQTFGYDLYKQHISKDNLMLMFGVAVLCLISAVALIYGVARNVASYLMPFFCMQVFDFCMSCLVAVGCFTYAPNVKHWIHDQGLERFPGMDHLMSMDSDYLLLLFVALVVLIVSMKAYLICMVWYCYKFIQIHVAARTISRDFGLYQNNEMLLPPCYEDAIKVTANEPHPPEYSRE